MSALLLDSSPRSASLARGGTTRLPCIIAEIRDVPGPEPGGNVLLVLVPAPVVEPTRLVEAAPVVDPVPPLAPASELTPPGGGGISNMNQSCCAIRNSRTFWLSWCSCGSISWFGCEMSPGRKITARSEGKRGIVSAG